MANKLYEETYIQNIANAIREKTGKTDAIMVSQMASEIGGIDTDLSNLSDLVGADIGDGKSDIENAVTGLINSANATTGNTDTNLTDGVNALIGGYGQGGSSNLLETKTNISYPTVHKRSVATTFHSFGSLLVTSAVGVLSE